MSMKISNTTILTGHKLTLDFKKQQNQTNKLGLTERSLLVFDVWVEGNGSQKAPKNCRMQEEMVVGGWKDGEIERERKRYTIRKVWVKIR